MDKAHIVYLQRVESLVSDFSGYYLRFKAADPQTFDLLRRRIKSYYPLAKWEPRAYEGKGAWKLVEGVLAHFKHDFDNYEYMLIQAQDEFQQFKEAAKPKAKPEVHAAPPVVRVVVHNLEHARKILGVSVNDPFERVKKRYRFMAKQYHEDVGGKKENMILINLAFDLLKKDQKTRENPQSA